MTSAAKPILTSTVPAPRRKFKVGTTGWTADDLDDPRIEAAWERGRYEIVEGVLTRMPPAYFDGSLPVGRLVAELIVQLRHLRIAGDFTAETDFIVDEMRVARVDYLFMTPEDRQRQAAAYRASEKGRPNVRFGRLVVPPTLVIESLSLGHEAHDRKTKRGWYAQAGVKNYWLLDGYIRSLECLVLDGADYRVDQAGKETDEVRPTLFPGVVIKLGELWA